VDKLNRAIGIEGATLVCSALVAQKGAEFTAPVIGISDGDIRAACLPPDASWISREMRPIAELCTGEEAHRQIQSHTLAHLNATLGYIGEPRMKSEAGPIE
jgi:hypothetical protein